MVGSVVDGVVGGSSAAMCPHIAAGDTVIAVDGERVTAENATNHLRGTAGTSSHVVLKRRDGHVYEVLLERAVPGTSRPQSVSSSEPPSFSPRPWSGDLQNDLVTRPHSTGSDPRTGKARVNNPSMTALDSPKSMQYIPYAPAKNSPMLASPTRSPVPPSTSPTSDAPNRDALLPKPFSVPGKSASLVSTSSTSSPRTNGTTRTESPRRESLEQSQAKQIELTLAKGTDVGKAETVILAKLHALEVELRSCKSANARLVEQLAKAETHASVFAVTREAAAREQEQQQLVQQLKRRLEAAEKRAAAAEGGSEAALRQCLDQEEASAQVNRRILALEQELEQTDRALQREQKDAAAAQARAQEAEARANKLEEQARRRLSDGDSSDESRAQRDRAEAAEVRAEQAELRSAEAEARARAFQDALTNELSLQKAAAQRVEDSFKCQGKPKAPVRPRLQRPRRFTSVRKRKPNTRKIRKRGRCELGDNGYHLPTSSALPTPRAPFVFSPTAMTVPSPAATRHEEERRGSVTREVEGGGWEERTVSVTREAGKKGARPFAFALPQLSLPLALMGLWPPAVPEWLESSL
eukprot:CAMPEP_0114543840 /NCGR_PEP_ID=MMETSP0114-20121206/2567_1 /TAXON_ID=31324 /ORGANISM="Goniomonas sp, Strain m" /LENGTH=581 /DNA_ID=CAMNT_0001728199 /DNA_START=1 /DNA_END=1744 /DNA_ORIENTATION=+